MTSPSDVIRLAKAAGILDKERDDLLICASHECLSRLITLARNEALESAAQECDQASKTLGDAASVAAFNIRALKSPE